MRRSTEAAVVAVVAAATVTLAGCQHLKPETQHGRTQDLGDMLQSACDGGSGLACATLARALEVADGRGEDRARVASLHQKASTLGYQLSCPPAPQPPPAAPATPVAPTP